MTVLQQNNSFVPFLSKRTNFVKGLDPLGLQNPSERTYSFLLPGLNNVTNLIRAYGFYCWLLGEYAKSNGSTDPKEQMTFIRKAEYILALLTNVSEEPIQGIPGILYASKQVESDAKKGFDLMKGIYQVDGSTAKTYWKFPFGAFGQYYQGSLRDIGLIAQRVNREAIYVRTSTNKEQLVTGEDLALAFGELISEKQKLTFLTAIQQGKINKIQLETLLPVFDITTFLENSTSSGLLIELLCDRDYPRLQEENPTNFRYQTIWHLLNFAQTFSLKTDRDLPIFAYEQKGIFKNELDDCLFGWYFYQLNEFWQFACTSILNGLLEELKLDSEATKWLHLPSFLKNLTTKCTAILNAKYPSTSFENYKFKQSFSDFANSETISLIEQYHLLNRSKGINRIIGGFEMFIQLYWENKAQLQQLRTFSLNHQLGNENDSVGYLLQFEKLTPKSLEDFINEFLYTRIIKRHQFVALRKMGGGTQSTLKFTLEENHIRYLGTFDAAFTGPRVNNLIQFLKSLNVLSKEHEVLSKGLEILKTKKI